MTAWCLKYVRALNEKLLQTSDLRAKSALLDVDKQWNKEPNFVQYDFSRPEDIPSNIQNSFDCVVIDPPFITEEVWTLYAAAARLLLKPDGEQHAVASVFGASQNHCITQQWILASA